MILKFFHDGLQPLFKVTAVPCAGQQCAHVEAEDSGVGQNVRRLALNNQLGEAFGNSSLAHAWIADQEGVVLAATAENLHAALNFIMTPDQRIDVSLAGFGVEIDAIFRKRAFILVGAALRFVLLFRILGAPNRSRFAIGGVFCDAVTDVVHSVIAGHVLLLQEERCMAFALSEDCD